MGEPNPEKPNRNPVPPPGMPSRFGRSLIWWAAIIGLALLAGTFFKQGLDEREEISPDKFWKYAKNGYIISPLIIREREIEGALSDKTPGLKPADRHKFRVRYNYTADQNFDQELRTALAGQTDYRYEFTGWWEGFLPQLLLLLSVIFLMWFVLFRRLGSAAGGGGFLGGFGRSRHRLATKEQSKVTFNDVAGIQEAKEEVREIIEFLKNPRKFQRLGGRVPRGVLLVGEPGCGKTLLAKAIAGEADVPFFAISGSDFVEMFVGVGASRVRDLFRQAKESSPCIIFLDEIDAVGRRRVNDHTGSGNESAQTLNAILVEMDGFDSSDQVIVIAATNRVDILDPALTRPGRFDRQIMVPLPDLQGRYEILKIYLGKIKAGPDVDPNRMARGTPMFSGADLSALVNEGAIAATMAQKEFVEQADLEEARDKVRWGRARKSRVIDDKEKEITAYHEAGHALVQLLTPVADPIHKVSIIPRGQMGGATFSLPEKDRYLYTRSYCKALMKVCLGGRLAEEIFCNDISSGASNDIAQATELAKRMVLDWGMSDRMGLVRYAGDEHPVFPDMGVKEYSDNTADMIDQEIRAFIDEAYRETRKLIQDNAAQLKALAEALLKYETLTGDEVRLIVEGKSLDKPTMGDLLDREAGKGPAKAKGVILSPPLAEPDAPPLPGTP